MRKGKWFYKITNLVKNGVLMIIHIYAKVSNTHYFKYFLMVEIPTLKPYIYCLFSYLFIKQDQMIMTCNSAVASLMLSRFLIAMII
jgi:hypothetical protein